MRINKIGVVITITFVVILTYLLLLVVIPNIVAPMALSANTAMDASSNMSLYPGTSGFLMSTPWILFWIPGVIGLALVVAILRTPSTS